MSNEVEFEYAGLSVVPKDVTIVRFQNIAHAGDCMFKGCKRLKRVVFNEDLKKIGCETFYGCKELEYINLPSTLIQICYNAFKCCENIETVIFNEGLKKITGAFEDCKSLKSITFPSTIIEAGDRTFQNCTSLAKVVVNEGLQVIGKGLFASCLSLESLQSLILSL